MGHNRAGVRRRARLKRARRHEAHLQRKATAREEAKGGGILAKAKAAARTAAEAVGGVVSAVVDKVRVRE